MYAQINVRDMSKHLVYLCDWLPPDFGAVGQYSILFARAWAQAGWDVDLVGLSSEVEKMEEEVVGPGRLRIHRIYAVKYNKNRLLARSLWTLRTNIALLWRARAVLRQADTILFTGSPPFLVHFIVPLNLVLHKQLIYRITDFHPECLMAEKRHSGIGLRLLYRLTIFWRRQVHQFEALGHDQMRRLLDIGIPVERIVLKRDPSPVTFAAPEVIPPPEPLDGVGTILYSGNWGVAHDHRTFIEGYRRYRESGGRLVLWLNATGAKVDAIIAELCAAHLPVRRGHLVPLEELAALLRSADVHLITLRDEFVGFVLPSKVYACIESAKPILYVGSRESDVHGLCAERLSQKDYRQVGCGDTEGVVEALRYFERQVVRACSEGQGGSK